MSEEIELRMQRTVLKTILPRDIFEKIENADSKKEIERILDKYFEGDSESE